MALENATAAALPASHEEIELPVSQKRALEADDTVSINGVKLQEDDGMVKAASAIADTVTSAAAGAVATAAGVAIGAAASTAVNGASREGEPDPLDLPLKEQSARTVTAANGAAVSAPIETDASHHVTERGESAPSAAEAFTSAAPRSEVAHSTTQHASPEASASTPPDVKIVTPAKRPPILLVTEITEEEPPVSASTSTGQLHSNLTPPTVRSKATQSSPLAPEATFMQPALSVETPVPPKPPKAATMQRQQTFSERLKRSATMAVSSKAGFEKFVIPRRYLTDSPAEAEQFLNLDKEASPTLLFINSRSGGQKGPAVRKKMTEFIGPLQVFDLAEKQNRPDVVLRALYARLDKAIEAGDTIAAEVRSKIRIVVAGGDGTVGWLLGAIRVLGLAEDPAVAIIPLGTGNDLSRSFGWGRSFSSFARVRSTLQQMFTARLTHLDRWLVTFEPGTDAHIKLPNPLAKRGTEGNVVNAEGVPERPIYEGGMWNYFSIGMDAQIAHGFHTHREEHPKMVRGRFINQTLYGYYGLKQGWLCTGCTCCCPCAFAEEINAVAKVFVADTSGEWVKLDLPNDMRALVILNLQSYAGGRSPWGSHDKRAEQKKFKVPTGDDGMLEVVGFRSGWDMGCMMAKVTHGVRLAQVSKVRAELHGTKKFKEAYLQIDGEPWFVPLPESAPATIVTITHDGVSRMLAALPPEKLPQR